MTTVMSRMLAVAALSVTAAVAISPTMAATSHHRDRMSLQARHPGAMKTTGTANANASFANANASANTAPTRPPESMATQLGATVTKSGNASDPVCQPGSMTRLPDGQMHPCQ